MRDRERRDHADQTRHLSARPGSTRSWRRARARRRRLRAASARASRCPRRRWDGFADSKNSGTQRSSGTAGRTSRSILGHDAESVSRFSLPPDPVFVSMNASIGFDWRLAPTTSRIPALTRTMLAATGIISDADRDELLGGLDRVAAELDAGEFAFLDSDEDIHMAVERRLTEIVGAVGGKLTPPARAATRLLDPTLAMFTRAHALWAIESQQDLQTVVVRVAEAHLTGRCRATRISPARAAGGISRPPCGVLLDVPARAARFEAVLELDHGAARRERALPGDNFPTDRCWSRWKSGLAGVVPNSIDAVFKPLTSASWTSCTAVATCGDASVTPACGDCFWSRRSSGSGP